MANDMLDSLGISITADTKAGVDAITNLIRALEKLERKTNAGGDFGLGRLAESLRTFGQSIREYTQDVEAYGNLLSMMGVKASGATKKVSSGMKSAAKDTKTAAEGMKGSLDGVGDSIKIISKEIPTMEQRLAGTLASNGGQNPLFTSITARITKMRSEMSAFNNWMNRYTPKVPLIARQAPQNVISNPASMSFGNVASGLEQAAPLLLSAKSAADSLSQALVPVRREETQLVVVQNEYQQQVIRSAEFWKRVGDRIRSALGDSETRARRLAKALEVVHGTLKKVEIAVRAIVKWAAKTAWSVIKALPSIIAKVWKTAVSALRSIFSGVKKIATPIAKFLGAGAKNLINTVKKIGELGKGLLRRIGRISLYRIVREVLAKAFENIYEGFENLYYWSSLVGYKFADAMNRIASASLLVRNSFAAMVEPLVTSVYPVIERIAARFAEIAALVGKFLAELLGRDSYVVAKSFAVTYKDALDDVASGAGSAAAAVDKYKNTLMGFDELNPINDVNERNPSGGGGGSGSGYSAADYEQMFEERATDLGSWAAQIGELIRSADWGRLGVELGAKINEVVDGIEWGEIGAKVGNWINALFTTEYWTLEVTNFENIGSSIAELVSKAIENIDWNIVGRTMASKMQAVADVIYGFFRDLDWNEVGDSIHDFFVGYAMQWTEWFNGKDWETVKTTFKTNLVNFFTGLNMSDIASAFSALGSAIFNAIKQGFPEASAWVETNIVTPISSAIKGDITWAEAGKSIIESIKKGFPVWKTWVVNNIIDPIGTAICGEENWAKVKTFFQNFPENVKKWMSGAADTLKEIGEAIGSAIAAGVRSYFDEHPIKEWIWGTPSDYAGQTVNLGGITFTVPQAATTPIEGVTYSSSVPATGDTSGIFGDLAGKTIELTAKFTDWWNDFKTDPWSYAKACWNASATSSGYTPWAYAKAYWNDSGSASGFTPWSYAKAYWNDSSNASGFSPWAYAKAKFNDFFETSGKGAKYWSDSKTLWAYGKIWFNDYYRTSNYGAYYKWSTWPWAYGKLWFSAYAFTSSLTSKIKSIFGLASGGIFTNTGLQPITKYASGGFPGGGQLFVAREAGPELVGNLKGHTAVMNNDQIVASVSAGVARAISNIEFHMNGAFGTPVYNTGLDEETMYRAFLRALNDSDIGDINLDGDVLYRKMVNRNNMNTRMTGVNAFG